MAIVDDNSSVNNAPPSMGCNVSTYTPKIRHFFVGCSAIIGGMAGTGLFLLAIHAAIELGGAISPGAMVLAIPVGACMGGVIANKAVTFFSSCSSPDQDEGHQLDNDSESSYGATVV